MKDGVFLQADEFVNGFEIRDFKTTGIRMCDLKKCLENSVKQIKWEDSIGYINPNDNNLFINIDKNRDVTTRLTAQLIIGISKTGLIPPAIVYVDFFSRFVVMDGQHRIVACHFLGYKVPFIKVDVNKLHMHPDEQTKHFNLVAKTWSAKDYEKYNRSKNIDFWILKKELSKRFPVNVPNDVKISIMLGRQVKFNDIKGLSEEQLHESYMIESESVIKKRTNQIIRIFNDLVDAYNMQGNYFFKGFNKFAFLNGLTTPEGLETLEEFVGYLFEFDLDSEFILPIPQYDSQWRKHFQRMYDKFKII